MAQAKINPRFDENDDGASVQEARSGSGCEAPQGHPLGVVQFQNKSDLPNENSHEAGPKAAPVVLKIVKDMKKRTGRSDVQVKHTLSATYELGKVRALETYQDLEQASVAWIEGARGKARRLKEDQPLQLLAILGGTFFMGGVLLRLWRSKHYGK